MPDIGSSPNKTYQRTDGTRSGATVWVEADAAGVDIVPEDHDTADEDMATSITARFMRDGGNTATADLPMGGNKFSNLGNAEAVNEALTFDQAQDNKHHYMPTVGGTVDAITLTGAAGLTLGAYATGQEFLFKAAGANTGAVTVAIDGLAATALVRADGTTALTANDIRADQMVKIRFDGTSFQLDTSNATAVSTDIQARVIKAGSEMLWSLDTIPAGWAKADGSALTKTDYPELDAQYFADSYPYGASSASLGVGTLNLPDARGEFIRVVDDGAGTDPDTADRTARGDGTGAGSATIVGTKQSFALEDHTHKSSFGSFASAGADALKPNTGSTNTGEVNSTSATVSANETRSRNIYRYLIVLINPTAASANSVGLFGYAYNWSDDTGDTDPGGGFLKIDNAALNSATQIFIDDVDGHGADVSDAIASWDDSDSTIKAQIKITKVGAPANFVVYDINGATVAATGYSKVQVSHIDSNGSFSASDSISVEVYRNGDKGARGDSGLNYAFDSSTTTTSDPGAGDARLNNAAFASVTEIAISDFTGDTSNPDISAFLLTWDDSTSTIKGHITFQKASAKENFAIYTISALTDETNFVRYTVVHVDSAGSFSNTDELSVFFNRNGDKGDTGATGADGANAGIEFTYDTNTNTGADPGVGDVRFNSGIIASITQLAVDDQSSISGNPTVADLINSWSNGKLYLSKKSAQENYFVFDVTSATNLSGYTQLNGTVTALAGSFSASDDLVLQFSHDGTDGTVGSNGADGISGGLYFKFDDSTNTAADPNTGHWRANNATLSSATQLAISYNLQESGNPDVSAFIATWDDSTNLTSTGSLIIKNRDNPEEFVTYNVTAITDQTTFYQITVTGSAGSGTLTDEDDTIIEYTRTGDKGADGAGAGDVTAAAVIADNTIVRGNGGAKGVQDSGITIDDSDDVNGVVNLMQTGYHDLTEIGTPANPGANVARIYSKDASGTTKLFFKRGSDEIQIAEGAVTNTLTFLATNDEGGALAAGDVVCLDTVTPWNVTDTRPNVQKADADVEAEMPAVGMVSTGGADGAEVTITSYGTVSSLDTSGESAGDSIYVDHTTPGGYTTTRPEAATQLVQKLGTVLLSNASTGRIFISGANRTNDIPNRMPSDRFRIADATDETKLVDWDVSAVSTATARTVTMPDRDVDLGTGSGIRKPETFIIAVSDTTSDLSTGTKVTIYMPYGFELTEVRGSVTTAPTGAGVIMDIHKDGTTVMTTNKITIDATEFESEEAGTQPTLTTTTLADRSKMEFIIDQVGSTVAGAGAFVYMTGYQT